MVFLPESHSGTGAKAQNHKADYSIASHVPECLVCSKENESVENTVPYCSDVWSGKNAGRSGFPKGRCKYATKGIGSDSTPVGVLLWVQPRPLWNRACICGHREVLLFTGCWHGVCCITI